MLKALVAVVASGVLGACGGGDASTTPPVTQTPSVASIVLSQTSATLVSFATLQLSATANDASGNAMAGQTISWSSSAPAVATVSATGLVTGVATGNATITATAGSKNAGAAISVVVPIPSGMYVLNDAANEQPVASSYAAGLTTAPGYTADIAGHAIFLPIAQILPSITTWGQFAWDWTYLDVLVQTALTNGKKFSVELETGFQSSSSYSKSLPQNFAATCGANCAPLFDVWTTGGGEGRCVSAYIPLPWVANVQQFWAAAANALAAHLRQTGAYASLTMIHVPGLSVYDEELRLPTGTPKPAATDTLPCPDGRLPLTAVKADADTAEWRARGYSDAAVVAGFKAIATSFAQAFPDRFLGLSIFPPGNVGIDFPNLTNDAVGTVAGQIVQSVVAVAPGRVQVQADNEDGNFTEAEVLTFAPKYSTAIGWQSNKHGGTGAGCNGGSANSCGPDGATSPFFSLLKNGFLTGGEYLEVWSADVVSFPLSFAAAKAAGYYPIH